METWKADFKKILYNAVQIPIIPVFKQVTQEQLQFQHTTLILFLKVTLVIGFSTVIAILDTPALGDLERFEIN